MGILYIITQMTQSKSIRTKKQLESVLPVPSQHNKLILSYSRWIKKGTDMQSTHFAMEMKYIYPKIDKFIQRRKNKEVKREDMFQKKLLVQSDNSIFYLVNPLSNCSNSK